MIEKTKVSFATVFKGNINLNTKKELESIYDNITQSSQLQANTFDNYFYPIIMKQRLDFGGGKI